MKYKVTLVALRPDYILLSLIRCSLNLDRHFSNKILHFNHYEYVFFLEQNFSNWELNFEEEIDCGECVLGSITNRFIHDDEFEFSPLNSMLWEICEIQVTDKDTPQIAVFIFSYYLPLSLYFNPSVNLDSFPYPFVYQSIYMHMCHLSMHPCTQAFIHLYEL